MKIRTIKELLQLMLDNQHLFQYGLCRWTSKLEWNNIINDDERSLLIKYFIYNSPSKLHYLIFGDGEYYWKCNKIEPRIKWIKKHIKLNS